MVDAGPYLGAVVYATASREEVAREGRPGLVSGLLYAPTDAKAAPHHAADVAASPPTERVKEAPIPVPASWVKGLKWCVGAVQT